jgi:hypothetical protein
LRRERVVTPGDVVRHHPAIAGSGDDPPRFEEIRVGVGSQAGSVGDEIDLPVRVLERVVGVEDEAGSQACEGRCDSAVEGPR